ncbi:MAG: ABC transporter ATP-binding protein [Acidimicrobiales bacterium]
MTIHDVSMGYVPGIDVVRRVSLAVAPGETVALLGPSGCGKTSLLRAVAGLEPVRQGSIAVGTTVVSGSGAWVKPEHRRVGMVFQDGALFPHLSVAANIAFGLRSHPRREVAARVEEALALVDLAGYGSRLPHTLSGGQRQRVALARSLAPSPAVLLLDEPFSALDAALRVQVRSEVGRILREIAVTTLVVTHDQTEAFVLGDRVAVMRDGRVEQIDTPDGLYRRPVNPWVAGFVGESNLLTGRIDQGPCTTIAATALGPVPIERPPHRPAGGAPLPGEDAVTVLVRPEQVSVGSLPAGADGMTAVVEAAEYHGHDTRYRLHLDDGSTLFARCPPEPAHPRGSRVSIAYRGPATVAWPLAKGSADDKYT